MYNRAKYVSVETCKLAVKRGFQPVQTKMVIVHHDQTTPEFYREENSDLMVLLPSQDELLSWLETQNKYINLVSEFYQDAINWNWQVLWYTPKEEWKWKDSVTDDGQDYRYPEDICEGTGWYGDNGEFPTRHQAIEAALVMALNKMDFMYRHNSIDQLAKLYNVDQKTFVIQLREFTKELGDWGFRDLTPAQLEIIVDKLGKPPILINDK